MDGSGLISERTRASRPFQLLPPTSSLCSTFPLLPQPLSHRLHSCVSLSLWTLGCITRCCSRSRAVHSITPSRKQVWSKEHKPRRRPHARTELLTVERSLAKRLGTEPVTYTLSHTPLAPTSSGGNLALLGVQRRYDYSCR